MNKSRKIITYGVSLIVIMIGAALFVSCDRSGVDPKFTKLIDERYEAINEEILRKFDRLNGWFGEEEVHPDAFQVDLVLARDKVTKREMMNLYEGYTHNIIENVFITPDSTVVYQLKMCTSKDCDPGKTTGLYHHYLSKGKVDFNKDKRVKILETEKIGEWTYYIVSTGSN